MSPILFFIIFFTCKGVGKIFLQINSAAEAFIDILIAAWEGLTVILSILCMSVSLQLFFLRIWYFGRKYSYRTLDIPWERQIVPPIVKFSQNRIRIIFVVTANSKN